MFVLEVDMDAYEETILKYFDDVDDFENMETDIRDLITYFIYYNFELEGMELILNDYSIENPETVFNDVKVTKISEYNG